jgi:hypothetical protein
MDSNPHSRTFEVHVGAVKLTYHTSPVKARQILEDANFRPAEEYVLESLKGAKGPPVHEYQADDDVDLTLEDSHHFRAVPRGGGRA